MFINPFSHISEIRKEPFNWHRVFSRPADFDNMKTNGHGKSVCVVGGGIAGLVAAYELTVRGYTVSLIEKEKRIGGRIYTHRFTNNAYGELGAFRIPLVHRAVYDYLELFGIPTKPFVFWNPQARLFFNGIHGTFFPVPSQKYSEHFDELKKAFPGFNLITPEGIGKGPQNLLFSLLVDPFLKEFSSDEAKWAFFKKGKISDLHYKLQTTKLVDYATSAKIGLSNSDWEFLSRTTGVGPLRDCTVAQFYFDMLPVVSSNMVEVVGGMDQLVNAFLKRLNNERIFVGFDVQKVTIGKTRVAVTGQEKDYSPKTRYFDFVVMAIPPISLQKVKFKAPQSVEPKMEAIRHLKMGPLAKSLIFSRTAFWNKSELFGGFSGFCASDLDILQTWFPGNQKNHFPESTESKDNAMDSLGYVLTASYRWGKKAMEFGDMNENERTKNSLRSLETLLGLSQSFIEKHIVSIKHKAWTEGYTLLAHPSNYQGILEQLGTPLSGENGIGRIFFAGEHMHVNHGWTISAVLSGLESVKQLLHETDRI